MKIFVCLKQVPDTETRLQLKPDKSGVEESGIKWIMNPYDEFAVEAALKLKEAKGAGSVTAVSVGPKSRVSEALRTANVDSRVVPRGSGGLVRPSRRRTCRYAGRRERQSSPGGPRRCGS